MTADKLKEIADLALRHNLIVISDEIYSRLVYGVEHTCFSSLRKCGKKPSFGWVFQILCHDRVAIRLRAGHREIIAAMTKIHQYTMLCAPIMGQKAAIEALKFGEPDIQEMVSDYNRRRLLMVKGFNTIDFPVMSLRSFLHLPVYQKHRPDLRRFF